jgi:acetyl-CoA C-acetyltransferase/acetyl-CoA acyltransferase
MAVSDVLIFDALRTPRGKGREGGGLAGVGPADLVKTLVDAMIARRGPAARAPDHFILGCVGQVGAQGGHFALVSKLHAGLSQPTAAWTLNNFCTSGLSAIVAGAEKVVAGGADLVLAGGVESMSHVPFLADNAAYYMDPAFSASLRYIPVALSADVLAHREKIGRNELDDVALQSHARAGAAQASHLAEQSLVPVPVAGGATLARDEYVRPTTSRESLARYGAAFVELGAAYAGVLTQALGTDKIDHVHAVVHAPGVADGAGLALLGTAAAGAKHGLAPRARLVAMAEAAGDPVLGLTAGRTAMERVLAKADLALRDIDLIEYMEAFAVVPALFLRDHPEMRERTNAFGGHVARGHALGATGAILLSQLVDGMEHKDARRGMVVTFAASGIGAAMIVVRD